MDLKKSEDLSSKVANNIINLNIIVNRLKLNRNKASKNCHICTQEFNCYIYQCLICKNGFKVCSNCFEKRRSDGVHATNHPVVRCEEDFNGGELFGIQFAPDQINQETFEQTFKDQVHTNVKCDCCSSEPIKGLRFKCDVCFDYDVCLECFKEKRETKSHKSKDHPMIVIGKTESFEIDHRDIELRDKLGQGAFGAVYLARLKKQDKIVACKIIECDVFRRLILGLNPHELLKSFIRELAVFKQVKGDNVHRLIGHTAFDEINIREENFQLFIVTEFMEKGSLTNLLQKEPDLPYLIRLEMAIGICSGMGRIHDLNFIHRDIRPDNILVDKNYTAKIADMGIAKIFDENKTTKMSLIGCPEYMPPEFYTGNYTKKLDSFTYGLTLNEMFEGRHRKVFINKRSIVFYDIVKKCISPQPDLRPDAKTIEKELYENYRKIFKIIEKNREIYDRLDSNMKNEMFMNIL